MVRLVLACVLLWWGHEAAALVPPQASLQQALAHYRQLGASDPWREPLAPLPGKKLEPGQAWVGTAVLMQRLVALGDLPANGLPKTPEPPRYEGALVEGVRGFQARHGLESDGVIGKDTWAQLMVAPAQRVRQIELTLERLRTTPLPPGPRLIVINVPEFMLRAYELRAGSLEPVLESRVIVGDARHMHTPLMAREMRFIEFSPYWNVPASIARSELVPQLRRAPGYFQQQGFEFVSTDGRVLSELSADNLDAVLDGQMRLRQRPGPKNALGGIKFVFPNQESIYLHDTPARQLFARTRRDFSHGCIRVQEPLALAKFVLQDAPEWSEERIGAAMARGQAATLRLKDPLPVVISYNTVTVRDGKVYFWPDLYGHDRQLEQALRQGSGVSPSLRVPRAAAQ